MIWEIQLLLQLIFANADDLCIDVKNVSVIYYSYKYVMLYLK